MPLSSITYISRAAEVRGERRHMFLDGLVKEADRNNAPLGVAGWLILVDDFFIQVLEGARGPISETYARIMVDDRHSDIHIVGAGPLVMRRFPASGLVAFDINSATNPVFSKYKVRPEFCPYQMAPHALADLIEQIALVCAKLDTSNRRRTAETPEAAQAALA